MSNQKAVAELPLDRAVLFSNHKGVYKKSRERRQRKLLAKLGFLRAFLREGEEILLISPVCSPASFFEQFMTGAIVYYLKRSLLVVTNQRILHVPTKSDYSYRNSIAQISYGDCTELAVKRGRLHAKYRDGSKEAFLYLKEAKKLKALLPELPKDGLQSDAGRRTHLCPRCTTELEKDVFTCAHCHLEFKSKEQGMKLAIVCPGGGYFYTRHPILGLGDAVTEITLIGIVLAILLAARYPDVQGGGSTQDLVVALGFFGAALFYEKVLSIYHANHFIQEFIPKDRSLGMGSESKQRLAATPAAPGIHRPPPIG